MKYATISVPMRDAQFLETRKFEIEEISRIFNVPLHMINDLEHATFSNIEQMSLEFVQYKLNPWIKRWEQSLTQSLLTPEERKKYTIKFNVDGLLRGDYQSRMQGYATAIQNGFMSPNDVRTLENMELIPEEDGGNKYMVNGSMTPLKDAGAAYQKGGNSEE